MNLEMLISAVFHKLYLVANDPNVIFGKLSSKAYAIIIWLHLTYVFVISNVSTLT